jgi:hypothetical protein
MTQWSKEKHKTVDGNRMLAVGGPHDGKMIEVSGFQRDKGFIRVSSSFPHILDGDGTVKMFVYNVEGNQLIFSE